jgi:hypothetical protein
MLSCYCGLERSCCAVWGSAGRGFVLYCKVRFYCGLVEKPCMVFLGEVWYCYAL